MRGWKILDHTADIMIEGTGETIEEAFEGIAIALQNVITDVSKVISRKKIKECIELRNSNREDWLFDFLNRLIFLKDTKKLIFKDVKVKIFNDNNLKKLCFEGLGDKINFRKYEIFVDAKGASYSNLEVIDNKDYYICRCIIDV